MRGVGAVGGRRSGDGGVAAGCPVQRGLPLDVGQGHPRALLQQEAHVLVETLKINRL